MVSDGKVREKVFLDVAFVDRLEGVGLRVQSQDGSFLISMGLTSASTAMLAAQRSIFSPGELIHLRTLASNSQLEFSERSPSYDSLHPSSICKYLSAARGRRAAWASKARLASC